MKRFILIIALIAAAMNVAAQSDTIVVKESKYHYTAENCVKKYVWRIDIINNSNENYLTWINETEGENGYGDINQIAKFYRSVAPRLFYFWDHAGFLKKLIGQTFLKVIRPKETFSYYIISNVNIEPRMKKRISIVKENIPKGIIRRHFIVSEVFDEPFLYEKESICLSEE